MKWSSRSIGEAPDMVVSPVRRFLPLDHLTPAGLVQGGREIKGSSPRGEQLHRRLARKGGNVGVRIERACDCSRELQLWAVFPTIQDNVIHELQFFGEKARRGRFSIARPTNERINQVSRANREDSLGYPRSFRQGRGEKERSISHRRRVGVAPDDQVIDLALFRNRAELREGLISFARDRAGRKNLEAFVLDRANLLEQRTRGRACHNRHRQNSVVCRRRLTHGALAGGRRTTGLGYWSA